MELKVSTAVRGRHILRWCLMKPLNVVVLQSDPQLAESLCSSLQEHFKGVSTARNLQEARHMVPKNRAGVAIVDLEAATLIEIDELRREFPELGIVCTHRLADEELWAAALNAGALDCCHPADVRSLVHAANRTVIMARTTAA